MTKVKELPVEIVPIDSLNLWEGNPRINAAAIPAVRRSIEYFGFTNPILARREDRMVIAGHTRIASLREMGEDTAPVIFLDLSEEDAKLLNITDNQTGQIAGWDEGKLSGAMMELGELNMDLSLTGFDVGRIRELTRNGDGGDEFDVEAALQDGGGRVERGQVWRCGDHRVMCGDSTDEEDVARLMAGETADVLLTDPPYGISIVRGTGKIGGAKAFGRVRQPGGKPSGVLGGKGIVEPSVYPVITGDDRPFDPAHLLGCAETLIIFGANHFASRLPESKGWIVWDKGVAPASTFSDAELIWTNQDSHVRMYRHVWSGLVRAGARDVEGLKRWHPTQKPVGLLEAILADFSEPDDTVSDPYLGSGSTLIAAERLGRRCYAMEIEPPYVAVALARWEAEMDGQSELLREKEAIEA